MKLAEFRRRVADYIAGPLVTYLSRTRLTPNWITLIGFIINIGATSAIIVRWFVLAGFLLLFAGLFDLIDGALARFKGQNTRFGALLDSTLDRFSEALILFGLLVIYLKDGEVLGIFLVFITAVSSFLVSYVRARAEGLGFECSVGVFTRAERVILLALGLFLDQVIITLAILSGLSFITVAQRLFNIWQLAKR